ncbi:hypothetical protein I551_8795 [Mycobacterium ulcerans str. Harvey]|uniref:Uncharacterized protein n=1 Tax=Mycobacterium ulcerans str. Harvey TaxID=1299332 RepID=A0ABN0R9R2_MYCUL|nr:hypothetical protein I551_8795 [Mycobacterium ulcerans str. Harvey]
MGVSIAWMMARWFRIQVHRGARPGIHRPVTSLPVGLMPGR